MLLRAARRHRGLSADRPARRPRVHDQGSARSSRPIRARAPKKSPRKSPTRSRAPASSSASSSASNRNRRAACRSSRAIIQDRYHTRRDSASLGRAAPQDHRRSAAVAARRCAAGRWWSTTSATCTASSWRSPATATRSRSCGATPSSSAASCCWCRTSRRSISSASSRKSSSWRSRGSGWRSWASTRSRSTPAAGARTSPPTAAACASATSTSRSIRKADFSSADDMLDLVIGSDKSGRQLFLRDVATIERGDQDPPRRLLRYDGKPAIGLGISTVAGRQRRDDGRRRAAQARRAQAPPADRHRDRRDQLPARSGLGGHRATSSSTWARRSRSSSWCCCSPWAARPG